MSRENLDYQRLNSIQQATGSLIKPWLEQGLLPDPVQIISIARTTGIPPGAVFDLLEKEPRWFAINGTYFRTALTQTNADIREKDLRQLRSLVPRNRDKTFTNFVWGESNRAVIFRSRPRSPKRQSYLPEVKARTKVNFIPSDPETETQQQRLTQRQAVKQRLAKRQGTIKLTPEILPTESDWLRLCQNPEALEQIPTNAILSIGFGVDNAVPVRVASYPLLALEMLRVYPQMTLEMYVATQFSWLNRVEPTTASANSRKLQAAINQFVQQAYPDVAGRITFLPTKPLTPERIQFLNQFATLLAKDPQLNEFASNRNGADSLRYLAAHSLYMRDPLPVNPNLYIVAPPPEARAVVMVGGDGEKIPWRARQKIAQYFGTTLPTQIFTTLGRIPPYFRSNQEPIIGERVTEDFLMATSPEIYRDYAVLLIAIARATGEKSLNFADINAQNNARKSLLPQDCITSAIQKLNSLGRL